MRFPIFLYSSTNLLLLAAAAIGDQSLSEALKNFNFGDGLEYLAGDGVLRSFNAARDSIIDYVQLSEDQIEEYLELLGKPGIRAGVDGRDVTSDAQLWAVPDEILPREPTVRISDAKKPRALYGNQKRAECDHGHTCDEHDDCYQWNCRRCVRDPPFGCPSFCPITKPRCAWNR
ncbi:hypothetical protein BDW02DRAFT_584170 [Decorospora gaudefroyi]|uniref:Uncharacterized protein n=1 Tax=Decorospora gaudefroyi TaxID=184978 RepID=A0A6A5K2Q9_9PLEO|nr:hypothetical protein BDW02DRAFT_584170 [Decorospora gaudefroyi]